MKAIEAIYKNYRMRSRLEATWAKFFDELGIKYDYEPEGFDCDGTWYLPDFWLPDLKMWVEIKPTEEKMREDEAKLLAFQRALSQEEEFADFYILVGKPFADIEHFEYKVFYVYARDETDLKPLEEYWAECPVCSRYGILAVTDNSVMCDICGQVLMPNRAHFTERLLGAYINARRERFERKPDPEELSWNLRAAELFERENTEPF